MKSAEALAGERLVPLGVSLFCRRIRQFGPNLQAGARAHTHTPMLDLLCLLPEQLGTARETEGKLLAFINLIISLILKLTMRIESSLCVLVTLHQS